jgi:hypothetical protein
MKSSIKMLLVLIGAAMVTMALAMQESPNKENQSPSTGQPGDKDRERGAKIVTMPECDPKNPEAQKLVELVREMLGQPEAEVYPVLPVYPEGFFERGQVRGGMQSGGLDPLSYPAGCTIPVFVIPSAETVEREPEVLDKAIKDLNIMCRVFDEQLGLPVPGWSDPLKQVIYLNYSSQSTDLLSGFLRSESRNTKAMYIEGYGALFYMNVPFELVASPEAGKPEEAARETVDESWRRAEQQLYGAKEPSKDADSGRKDDPQAAENFKSKVIETLKQVGNIRCLEPDELVVVAVRDSRWTGAPPIMSFRAKKSDIDAWAKGGLDREQFREKLLILTYPEH